MCADRWVARARVVRLLVVVAVLAASAAWALPALAADPRYEAAQQAGRDAQAELDQLLQRISAMDVQHEEVEARLAELRKQAQVEGEREARADAESLEQLRELYIHGTTGPDMAMWASDSPEEAAEQARLLAYVLGNSQTTYEDASAGRVRNEAAADRAAEEAVLLQQRAEQLQAARAEAERLVAEKLAEVNRIRQELEEAARYGGIAPNAPVNGGIACPIGEPHSFSNTWGQPRSGGRSHKGVDMMAPHGTPLYAYENGTITRMNSNSLGGISLYLSGDSGNLYYYTHLSGYVSGINAGDRVSAGQHIAHNGMTGNAPVPHLHFEVMPGGGGNVNPYPYALRACG
jgi:peptidoglycan LD-endopeptidase LytH